MSSAEEAEVQPSLSVKAPQPETADSPSAAAGILEDPGIAAAVAEVRAARPALSGDWTMEDKHRLDQARDRLDEAMAEHVQPVVAEMKALHDAFPKNSRKQTAGTCRENAKERWEQAVERLDAGNREEACKAVGYACRRMAEAAELDGDHEQASEIKAKADHLKACPACITMESARAEIADAAALEADPIRKAGIEAKAKLIEDCHDDAQAEHLLSVAAELKDQYDALPHDNLRRPAGKCRVDAGKWCAQAEEALKACNARRAREDAGYATRNMALAAALDGAHAQADRLMAAAEPMMLELFMAWTAADRDLWMGIRAPR